MKKFLLTVAIRSARVLLATGCVMELKRSYSGSVQALNTTQNQVLRLWLKRVFKKSHDFVLKEKEI